MRISRLSVLVFTVVSMFLGGCATSSDVGRRFHESASADLVLRFSRWDNIRMMVPDSREDGFLPILTKSDVDTRLKGFGGEKRLAVVVFSLQLPNEPDLIRDWESLLKGRGYQRVVILRTDGGKSIDGLLIAHDSDIAAAHDEKRPRTFSALSPAFGADVANPSGR